MGVGLIFLMWVHPAVLIYGKPHSGSFSSFERTLFRPVSLNLEHSRDGSINRYFTGQGTQCFLHPTAWKSGRMPLGAKLRFSRKTANSLAFALGILSLRPKFRR